MKCSAVIFTWPPDYLAAAYAARALLRIGVRVVLAIDAMHPPPMVEGCEVIVTSFARQGNLNGKKCVEGILRTLWEQSREEDEWVLKVDSDCLVMAMRWLDGRTEEAVGMFHPGHRGFFGFCYGILRRSIPALRERAADLPADAWLHEDETIGELARPAHRYENLKEDCPMAAYPWKTAKPHAHWLERYQIMVFQRVDGKGRRDVAGKMREFLG